MSYRSSNTRNKLIAEAFYLTGDIEKYGSGFIRIRNEIRTYPTMVFSFENAPNGFITKLSYDQQKTSESVVENVVENERKIVELIHSNPKYTAIQIAILLQLNQRTVQRYLRQMQEKGIIERIGSARGGSWKIIKIG
ncbi:ATP-binding protein [Leadbetterella sp. DM7]|uniref:ATP-binding protein n=1 Tax=Leadbetterella sp. DM7 TaxID=3235085 RepID=UPI00349E4D60